MTIAYLAGLIDGEGCLQLQRSNKTTLTSKIKISMTHKEVLCSVLKQYGGKLYGPYAHKGQHNRYTWEWNMIGSNAYLLLKELLPYLIVKKREAMVLVDFYEKEKLKGHRNQWNPITDQEKEDREEIYLLLQKLKKGDDYLWVS